MKRIPLIDFTSPELASRNYSPAQMCQYAQTKVKDALGPGWTNAQLTYSVPVLPGYFDLKGPDGAFGMSDIVVAVKLNVTWSGDRTHPYRYNDSEVKVVAFNWVTLNNKQQRKVTLRSRAGNSSPRYAQATP